VKLTARQEQAQAVLAGPATHTMLFGGSRSGKTFLHVRNVIFRALKGPGGRHAIFRFRLAHLRASVVLETFPNVMRLAFPGVDYKLDKQDLFATFENGSEIWFAGLDDKDRVEKILGKEYVTLLFNECSQIPQQSVDTAVTRLAQLVYTKMHGREPAILKPRAFYDCNPPPKSHWTYKRFVEKRDPESKQPLSRPEDYAAFQMNPEHNVENLSAGYIETLKGLSARLQRRFLKGEFGDATPNQLFTEESIDRWRVLDGRMPEMIRIVVGVDPSGSGDIDNADNDAIGIAVGGLGTDGNAYLLEDCTVKAGPATWGRIAASAYDRHQANVIVGESNYGGAMVQSTIQTARPRTPYKAVTATRGKHIRAEPFSALYEQGKVRHAGDFPELEDELCGFSTVGYVGNGSPNRADAWIWVLSELFPGLTRSENKAARPRAAVVNYKVLG
jgi:phage terminase large subunit-like protein